MDPKVLVETALHVLIAWNAGQTPAPADVEMLRGAFPSSGSLADDELACQVIHHLSDVAFRRPQPPADLVQVMDDVA